ncbi:MAG: UDP-2,3-diacylglucosamine diphosphatase [Pseudomonadales bacterium]|jgi:UDP-2,3-diacylglucosamine pyrophosphatase LpxH
MNIRSTSEPGKTHLRAIFLSDIHLGTRGCQAEKLVSFLKHHTCDQLYLVGDIVDGWRMKSAGIYWPQSHINVVRRVLTMTKRGTEVIYVTGNHDEFLRDHSPLEIGNLRIVDEADHHTLDGRRFLVVHGDQFDVITRYHRWIAWLGDVGYTILLELNRFLNAMRHRLGYGYWSLSAWLKHKVKRAVNYIGEYEEALARHCRRQGYDGVICGHIHHAEIGDFGGVSYMNCGDWVESCTALVEDERGGFRIIDWGQSPEATATLLPFEDERLSA